MLYTSASWHFDISVTDPQVLYSRHICEILLYNRLLVVLTHEQIYVVRLLTARGKIIVKKVYCIFLPNTHQMLKCIAHSKKNTLQNISTLHIEILLAKANPSDFNELAASDRSIILDIFSSSPIYACIRRKQKWQETAKAVHNIYIYIVVLSFWISLIWLVVYVDYTANELWRALVSPEHPRISSLYLMHELQHCNRNPFYAYQLYTCTVCLFRYTL